MSEISINELARDFIAARQGADWQNIGNLDWEEAKVKQLPLATQIRSWLLHKPLVLSDDPGVTQILREIDLADCHDPYETGTALLYDLIRPEEYLAALGEIILIVPIGTHIPEQLRSFFKEARQCYALGQFAAVQSLCRTILESTVNEIGILTGEWTRKQLHTTRFRRSFVFKDRVNLVSGKEVSGKMNELYKDLCNVVHGAATSTTYGASGALTKTVGFVEYLYGRHKSEKGTSSEMTQSASASSPQTKENK
jgi:hypothetical protein